ncbi:MAG: LacI family DNA-binding transcriptional regulator [Candidatus Paceibacterota bacterium]|jgi:DNA-binding LacI/PurR family transcriptional regulator
MAVTIKDIARLAKVHHSTVVRVLNSTPTEKISKDVSEKILAIAKKIGYRKNVRASMFKRGAKDIGVFVGLKSESLCSNPLYQQIVSHLLVAAGRKGKRLVYCNLPPATGADSIPEEIDDSLYSGLVVLGGDYPSYIDEFAGRIPVLQLFRVKPSKTIYQLVIDNDQASELILKYYQVHGIKRPLLLYSPDIGIVMEKVENLLAASKKYKHAVKIEAHVLTGRDGEMLFSGEYDIKRKNFFTSYDSLLGFTGGTYRLYAEIIKHGIELPPGYPFIVYDNLPFYRQLFPELIAIGVDYAKLAERILSFFELKEKNKINYMDVEMFTN